MNALQSMIQGAALHSTVWTLNKATPLTDSADQICQRSRTSSWTRKGIVIFLVSLLSTGHHHVLGCQLSWIDSYEATHCDEKNCTRLGGIDNMKEFGQGSCLRDEGPFAQFFLVECHRDCSRDGRRSNVTFIYGMCASARTASTVSGCQGASVTFDMQKLEFIPSGFEFVKDTPSSSHCNISYIGDDLGAGAFVSKGPYCVRKSGCYARTLHLLVVTFGLIFGAAISLIP